MKLEINYKFHLVKIKGKFFSKIIDFNERNFY